LLWAPGAADTLQDNYFSFLWIYEANPSSRYPSRVPLRIEFMYFNSLVEKLGSAADKDIAAISGLFLFFSLRYLASNPYLV